MQWDASPEAAWERGYAAAEQYYKEHGDLDAPARHEENGMKLGIWLNNQRAARRAQALPAQREQRLGEIGMIWDVRQWRAERNREMAEQYRQEHGRAVPARHVSADGKPLGRSARYARAINNEQLTMNNGRSGGAAHRLAAGAAEL
jgi:hypothetical protein